jgi:phenylalanyl-tRNA synthetase beta chain
MAPQAMRVSVQAAARLIGIELTPEAARGHLLAMRHDCVIEGDALVVAVAPYRNDVMHEVDLIEDIAMAYGYDNVAPRLVQRMTIGEPRPERTVAKRARAALIGHGYFEVMTLLLSNEATQYELLGEANPGTAVEVAHPISADQTIMRTSLKPGLLRLFALNRGQGLPQRIFEVDDVVRLLPGETEPREELHLAAGLLARDAGFADVRALAESLGAELGLALTFQATARPGFLPGRVASVHHGGVEVGVVGEVHPEVLEKLRLITPLALVELSLEPLLAPPGA